MNLRFAPFRAVRLVAVSIAEPGDGLPRHVRVVDVAVGRVVRRLALDPAVADRLAVRPGAVDPDAAQLDALIVHASNPDHLGGHECGGA